MTEQHVPAERLAAYAAGDLDAPAAVEVEAHVLLCADCRADVDAVRRATAALAALPPVTMPDGVAARVDAAVAAAGVPEPPVGDVLPLRPARGRPSWAGIAAVAAGVALFGAITVPLVTGGSGNDAGSGSPRAAEDAGGRATATTPLRVESGLNYRHDTLRATLDLALRRDAAVVAGAPLSEKGAAGSPAPTSPQATVKTEALFSFRNSASRLDACVAALAVSQTIEAAKVPLLVDFARFDGRPAVVVVFPTITDGAVQPDRVDVWVVGERCGITPGDDDVLDFARFARPDGL
jgi:hypothetical protein